jgi:hypothetical protein
MDMGVVASERAHQTTYNMRRWDFFKWFLGTSVQEFVGFPIVKGSAPEINSRELNLEEPRIQLQSSYGHRSVVK